MKIERNVHKVDGDDVFYVEPRGEVSRPAKKSAFRLITPFVITALAAATGKVALTQKQLRDVVVGEGLVVYWLGPEDGARYTLISVNVHQNYVRYLPGGQGLNDLGANFRVVGTYKTKNAFKITQSEANSPNGVGLTSSDGNAIYYKTTRPLSVYVGLKHTDDQIELFNPTAGQALGDARTPGLIQRIR
jgi:hypothetical protein